MNSEGSYATEVLAAQGILSFRVTCRVLQPKPRTLRVSVLG